MSLTRQQPQAEQRQAGSRGNMLARLSAYTRAACRVWARFVRRHQSQVVISAWSPIVLPELSQPTLRRIDVMRRGGYQVRVLPMYPSGTPMPAHLRGEAVALTLKAIKTLSQGGSGAVTIRTASRHVSRPSQKVLVILPVSFFRSPLNVDVIIVCK